MIKSIFGLKINARLENTQFSQLSLKPTYKVWKKIRQGGSLCMDSSIPGQESCQRMTGPLTDFVHKIVKS